MRQGGIENSPQLDVPGMPRIAFVACLHVFLKYAVQTNSERVVRAHWRERGGLERRRVLFMSVDEQIQRAGVLTEELESIETGWASGLSEERNNLWVS